MTVDTEERQGSNGIRNVVLVHGGFVDGSGWQGVHRILTAKGYTVAVVQNPTQSLADDVTVTHRALSALDGPAILVGHSYGGVVISDAGNHPARSRSQLGRIRRAGPWSPPTTT